MRPRAWYALIVAAAAIDRAAKWYATVALPPEGVALFPGFAFRRFENDGLVFSIGNGPFVTLIATCALIGLGAVAVRAALRANGRPSPRAVSAGLLVAVGGASNVIDRIATGSVTDYLIFTRSAWNLADIMILAGIALLIVDRGATGGRADEQISP